MAKIIIKHDNIAKNVAFIKQTTNKEIIAVVKNNAYNTGLLSSAQALYHAGVRTFFVTELDEGLTLKAQFKDCTIIVMNSLNQDELEHAKVAGIHVSINSFEYYQHYAPDLMEMSVHININSGMNRFGITDNHALHTICQSNLNIVGIYTHFALAEEEDLATHEQQVKNFAQTVMLLKKIRTFEYIHAENTATFLHEHKALVCCTHIRVGILLFGYSSIYPVETLKPTIYLTAKVIEIRSVPKGGYIGYGFTPQMKTQKNIAVLDIGYGHGLIRERIHYPVMIENTAYTIFKMSMSHAFVYADDHIKVGDCVEVYGDCIRIDTIKNALNLTNSYQMATLIHNYS